MKRGLNSLATISSVAPFFGVFGTVLGIVNSFTGFDGEKSQIFGALTRRLSESLVPVALSLLIALLALGCYKYLLAKLDTFDLEMKNASLQLLNDLRLTSL